MLVYDYLLLNPTLPWRSNRSILVKRNRSDDMLWTSGLLVLCFNNLLFFTDKNFNWFNCFQSTISSVSKLSSSSIEMIETRLSTPVISVSRFEFNDISCKLTKVVSEMGNTLIWLYDKFSFTNEGWKPPTTPSSMSLCSKFNTVNLSNTWKSVIFWMLHLVAINVLILTNVNTSEGTAYVLNERVS